MEVKLKKGARVKTDAETIFAEIEASKVDGDVSLQTLVDRAKPAKAPLHDEFTWKNSEAANSWRLYEARKVVQSVEVVHEQGNVTRAYESVVVDVVSTDPAKPTKTKHVFRSTDEIMSDPETRSDVLRQAINDFHALRKRYSGLQELAKVHAAIDRVILDATAE